MVNQENKPPNRQRVSLLANVGPSRTQLVLGMGNQKFSLKKTHANYSITLGIWLKQKGGLNLGSQGQRTRLQH